MWRHAHGRLAAIAMLGGGLLACAPAPAAKRVAKAPAPVDDVEADREDERGESCGGTKPGPPAARDVVEAIEDRVRRDCTPGATAGGRQGEVRVVLHVDPKRQPEPGGIHPWRPKLETELHFDLTQDDRRCVETAARAAFASVEEQAGPPLEEVWSEMRRDATFYVAVGEPKPLFPPRPDLIERWQAAARSSAARERLRARLPAGVTLTDDDCLSMIKRPAYTDRVEAWLATVGTPLDAYWKGGDQAVDRPEGKWFPRRYLIGSRTTVVHYKEVGDRTRQEICLLPFDEFVLEQLQARGGLLGERQGSCAVRPGSRPASHRPPAVTPRWGAKRTVPVRPVFG